MPRSEQARARLLERLFQGRPELHARRLPEGGWELMPGTPRPSDLERHVRGDLQIALYPHPVAPRFTVLTVAGGEEAEALVEAARCRRVPLAHDAQGRRFWVPFAGPVPLRTAREVGLILLAAAGLELALPHPDSPQLLPTLWDGAWEALAELEPLQPWRAGRLSAERLDRDFGPLPLWAPRSSAEAGPAEGLRVILGRHLEVHGPIPRQLEALLEQTRMARTPKGWVRCWGRSGDTLVCAPGAWPDLQRRLEVLELAYDFEDRRFSGIPRPPQRRPVLRQDQTARLSLVLERDRSRVPAPGEGRLLARAAVAARGVPALVVTSDVGGWLGEVQEDLGIPLDQLGILDGGMARLGPLVSVASWQMLANRDLSGLDPYVSHLVLEPGAEVTGPAVVALVRQFHARHVLTLEPESWGASPAMLLAWLGERVQVEPREIRPPRPPRVSADRSSAVRVRPRRRDVPDQLLLDFE